METQNKIIELCPERQKIILLDAAGFSYKLISERIPLKQRTFERRVENLIGDFADHNQKRTMTMVNQKISLWNVLPVIIENHKEEYKDVIEPMLILPKISTEIKDGEKYIYIHL